MTYTSDSVGVVLTTLAADVANNGTVTVGYPTGYAQGSFNANLAGGNGYVIVAGNDKWTVAAGKVGFTFGASNITITNTSGQTWSAGTSLRANLDVRDGGDTATVQIPFDLAAITANGDVAAIRPGLNGYVEYMEFGVTVPVTTGAKLATLTPKINTTLCTGGAVALTSANATPIGATIAGTDVTANNRITAADTLKLTASGVTAFAEGRGFVNLRIRKDPT